MGRRLRSSKLASASQKHLFSKIRKSPFYGVLLSYSDQCKYNTALCVSRLKLETLSRTTQTVYRIIVLETNL